MRTNFPPILCHVRNDLAIGIGRRSLASPFTIHNSPFTIHPYLAPVPARTTGTVHHRIFRSSQKDQLSMYSRSRRTQSRKSERLLRPLICQRQVRPGLTLKRRRWARSLKRLTSSTGSGRGPTRLISPRSTLKSCEIGRAHV